MSSDFLVVFDCDGVLVDSERLMQDVDMRMIADLGWAITRNEIFDQFLGRSESVGIATIERKIGRPVPADFVDQRRAEHAAAFSNGLAEVRGVRRAVTDLQSGGYVTCVASSGRHTRIRSVLHMTDLFHFFDGQIFSGDDVEHGKPSPDLFLYAAESMGYRPAQCVVVEDSPAGVAAAQAAKMPVVGYCAVTPIKALAGADVLVSDMHDLTSAIVHLTSRTSGST
ncbi:MAG: HAD family phosphatase [Actinomycetota bacterium]|nr:HAD family phosphatase [Actinomycetota bacterium]